MRLVNVFCVIFISFLLEIYANSEYLAESSNNVNPRFKRDDGGVPELVVETLFILDYSIYRLWMTYYQNNKDKAIESIRYHFATIAQGIDRVYQGNDGMKYKYSVKMVGYYICQTPSDSDFIERYKTRETEFNIDAALLQLSKWNGERLESKQSNVVLPKFDLAIVFTSYSSGLMRGLAYPKAACTTGGVGIVRNLGQLTTTFTAAHEIGHILGAGHDGYQNTCFRKDNYLMSGSSDTYDRNNYTQFSPCSKKELDDYVTQLDSEKRNCMLKTDLNDKHEDIEVPASYLPGTIHSPDAQCHLMYGNSKYKFCNPTDGNYSSICSKFTCYDNEKQFCSYDGGKAMPGTPCGDKMWCIGDKCVSDDKASEKKDPCMFGDFTGEFKANDGRLYSCKNFQSNLKGCNIPGVRSFCCKTCPNTASGVCASDPQHEWCQRNLRNESDKQRLCPEYAAEMCCNTCYKYLKKKN
ncbi:hypothetical protein HELRODRAFT_194811 [Helobdella robusta]|uniref:Peptidase M12B domain-containing protein n=1 Tax=Helobdella robusta TaxID=6412 RepID=T1FWF8_HELRO|nr:hypothetical protein HELRODRAFT_194811 [Helobdella robusta]ESO11413.1 hypothetical protein HELRODRAFT_194811 [Helobdella robusta]